MIFAHAECDTITEYGVMFASKDFGKTLNVDTFIYETIEQNVPLNKAQISKSNFIVISSTVDFLLHLILKWVLQDMHARMLNRMTNTITVT